MEKDTRTEFEKMEAGEMFWNSDAKNRRTKKHARRLADRFKQLPKMKISFVSRF